MNPRKIVATAGLVTFTLSSVPYTPPAPPRSNVRITLSGGKVTVIELDKTEKGGESAHSHPLHSVGTIFATDSSTLGGRIALADNAEFVAGAASERIADHLNFVAQQRIQLPPFMR